MTALNTSGSTIAVVLAGTDVSLPNSQLLSSFTVDGTNTVFTATEAGTYAISYSVNLTQELLLSTQILLNGSPLPGSILSPTLAQANYSLTFLATLAAGDTLELQLFGLLGSATLQSGTGASLTAIKLS